MEEAENMFPPTPDRFIDDAKALIYGTAPEPYKKSQKTNELRVIAVAIALHSIQAQTIREMEKRVEGKRAVKIWPTSADEKILGFYNSAIDDVLDVLLAYAKEKNVSL